MTLAEAHTENVKRAWEAYKADQGTPISWGPHGWLHTNHPGGYGNPTRTKIRLSQALDLLAWVTDEAAKKNPRPPFRPLVKWEPVPPSIRDRERGSEFKLRYSVSCMPLFQGTKFHFTNTESLLEAILLAIDAIVEKHPEVLEDA